MKNLYLLFVGMFLASCASVGAVIDGGKKLGTSAVDITVSTAGDITASALQDVSGVVSTVADATSNVVDVVVENVDKQTDELEDKKEEK
jgi:hypothetical protein